MSQPDLSGKLVVYCTPCCHVDTCFQREVKKTADYYSNQQTADGTGCLNIAKRWPGPLCVLFDRVLRELPCCTHARVLLICVCWCFSCILEKLVQQYKGIQYRHYKVIQILLLNSCNNFFQLLTLRQILGM